MEDVPVRCRFLVPDIDFGGKISGIKCQKYNFNFVCAENFVSESTMVACASEEVLIPAGGNRFKNGSSVFEPLNIPQ